MTCENQQDCGITPTCDTGNNGECCPLYRRAKDFQIPIAGSCEVGVTLFKRASDGHIIPEPRALYLCQRDNAKIGEPFPKWELKPKYKQSEPIPPCPKPSVI